MRYFCSLLMIILTLLSSSTIHAKNIFNHNGNKLEIYGSINPNHELSHKVIFPKMKFYQDKSASIIGLSGETQITNIFSSYFHIEYNSYLFFPENAENQKKINYLNIGYAGIKYGNFGSIDFGRNYGVMHDVQSLTNYAPYIIKNSIFENSDHYMINRNNGLITYRNENIFDLIKGLSITLQYQSYNEDKKIEDKTGPGWGASVKYNNNAGLTVMGAVFSSNKSYFPSNKNLKSELVESYGLGLKYDVKNLFLGAFYGTAHHMTPYKYLKNDLLNRYIDMTHNFEIITGYAFDSIFSTAVSYLYSEGQNINSIKYKTNGHNLLLAQHIDFVTRCKIYDNFSAYINYKINLLNNNEFIINNNINTDNTIGAGIVYQF